MLKVELYINFIVSCCMYNSFALLYRAAMCENCTLIDFKIDGTGDSQVSSVSIFSKHNIAENYNFTYFCIKSCTLCCVDDDYIIISDGWR